MFKGVKQGLIMHVCIYSDKGVGPFSLKQIVARLRERGDSYELLSKEKLIRGEWLEKADVFMMPGGRDIPYDRALSGKGCDILSSYVHQGGHYFGICAGAYFACHEIEFDKGTQIEVSESRDLKFYPGNAKGPAFGLGTYSYESEIGARAAHLKWKDGAHFNSYFNGGCYFQGADQYPDVEVFANYSQLGESASAVIRCNVGKGVATLSGVHIEYSPKALSMSDPYLEKIIPQLKNDHDKVHAAFNNLVDLKAN